MKNHNTTDARKTPPKVAFESTDSNLTSQAGLIPVVKFLDSLDLIKHAKNVIPHNRANNATYQLADIIPIAVIAFVAGAKSRNRSVGIF